MKFKNIIISAMLIAFPAMAGAQSTGAELLRMSADARTTTLGGNIFGESENMLVYGNPTSIYCGERKLNISTSFRGYNEQIIKDQRYYAVGASYRLGRHAAHFGYRRLGGLEVSYIDVLPVKPVDYSFDFGYSYRINKHFSAAATVSYIESKVVEKASTYAFGASAFYRTNFGRDTKLTAGLGLGNFGGELEYKTMSDSPKAELPSYYGLGGELSTQIAHGHDAAVSLGYRHIEGSHNTSADLLSIGAEYTLFRTASWRVGYMHAGNDNDLLTCGATVRLSKFQVGFSYIDGIGDNPMDSYMITIGLNL